jgi:ribosomal protein L20A (L18A)
VLEEISRDSALDGVVSRFGSRALVRRIKLVKEVYAI